ncbi:MAG: hypothetical protein BroJett040_15890 [Oligoflexia bacterium]|nr:MAG: hypothetical protein BroJett040_15890 [Oligoflexia bacterium]
MRYMRRFIFILLFGLNLLGLYGWASGVTLDLLPVQDAVMMKTPDDGHDHLNRLIGQARISVHMMIYHLSDETIVESLIAASQRGVEVTVIMDRQSTLKNSGKILFEKLNSSGVRAVQSSKAFSISHVKAFSIDRKTLFVSTMNFIKSWAIMRDYGLTTSEPTLVEEYEKVFAADLVNAQNNTKDTPELTAPNLVWSPVNSRERLTKLIDSAQSEVEAQVENLTDAYVIASLGNAAKRGVHVRLLTPQCVLGGPYNNDKALKMLNEVGVDTRVMPNPSSRSVPYMHTKTLSIDGRTAFLGSENYSLNSLSYAREFGIVFQNASAIDFLHKGFEEDWGKSVKYSTLPEKYCDKAVPLIVE